MTDWNLPTKPQNSRNAPDGGHILAEDQSRTVAFLGDPASYGASEPIETLETHVSRIFLTGDRAFKMKRAVKLPYVDFSSPALRLAACEKEVAYNSATAPQLYLGVRRITEEDGEPAFDGEGLLVDAVVEMKRFEQDCLLDRMAGQGRLTPRLMHDVARMIARFHHSAPVVRGGAGGSGGAANIAGVLDINEAGFATSHVFDDEEVASFNAAFRTELARHAELLDAREERGRVRRCHGDLHLRNICLFDGVPTLFDCIEFNDTIATVDVLYDLAFLLMDLWHRGLRDLANLVANRYLDGADDEDGFTLLPFFMAVRAGVRAHVTATQVEEGGDGALAQSARAYFDLARELLRPHPARLIAIGGFSGTGKTTVAEALAFRVGAPPGARIAESDRVRKAMFKVPVDTRLGAEAYRSDVSKQVYDHLAESARLIAGNGGTVIVDAVYDRPERRAAIAGIATQTKTPFTGIWLEADAELLRKRVAARTAGPSDATVDVLEGQLAREAGAMDWMRIDAAQSPERIAETIMKAAATR